MDGIISHPSTLPIQCAACLAENNADDLFCSRCTAPLAITALRELDETDLRLCRAALLEVLTDAARLPPFPAPAPSHDESLWRAYLSAFWLRPETALVLYAEALALRSLGNQIGPPWLDLGCGDGIHAALIAGWRFAPEFDAFQALDLDAKDIYHHWDPTQFHVDVQQPGHLVDFGIDIKPTAAARATALGAFHRVACDDARHLSLADKSIKTIFSNMLRDLGEPLPAALRECRRVLRDDGVLLLSAMTPSYAGSLYFLPAARTAQAAGNSDLARRLLRLDRGRSSFCQQQLSVPHWRTLLAEHGLRLVDLRPMVSPPIIRFWDVGLRSFSLRLLKQRQTWISAGTLSAIKPAAVEFIAAQLDPLIQNLNAGDVHCMNLLVVRKS